MAVEETIDGPKVIRLLKEHQIERIDVTIKTDPMGLRVAKLQPKDVEVELQVLFNGQHYQGNRRIWLERPDDFSSILDEALALIKHTLVEILRKEAKRL